MFCKSKERKGLKSFQLSVVSFQLFNALNQVLFLIRNF